MRRIRKALIGILICGVIGTAAGPIAADERPKPVSNDTALSDAICPIVYPLDESPGERGFHYLFYGNGFFINEQGYLLTAAHVLSQLTDVQPYIVLRLPMAPPALLKTTVVAVDQDHDVALLRATPNPFQGKYQVRFLPLAVARPAATQAVLAAALRPSRLKDPHTYDAFLEDRPAGEVLEYEFSELDKGRADTELLLFSHGVLLGDSGAPLVSAETQAVVGLVEGRWLRADAAAMATVVAHSASGVAAAVPIHYAIPVLLGNGVAWHEAADARIVHAPDPAESPSGAPVPLSLVSAPYPSQGLEGGEVVLDAQLDDQSKIGDVKVFAGDPPFLDKVLSAIHSWTFRPTRSNEAAHRRMGILFQFARPGGLAAKSALRHYEMPRDDAADRPALPMVTKEPEALAVSNADASVIVSVHIDAQGMAGAMEVLQDPDSLAPVVTASIREWQFSPAKRKGTNCDSTMMVVIIPRHHATAIQVRGAGQTIDMDQ
ncbi:MAG TPA: serine protease [Candidatus Eremiobacteraceae bacterium]|nr:serine protease [Candidatus Eremiobacteraceae bacterium]